MPDTAPSGLAAVPRALTAAVIGMGIAIVVGVAVLAGVLVHRMAAPSTVQAPTLVARHAPRDFPPGRDLALPVPAGTRIVSITARGDGSLAILLEANRPDGGGQDGAGPAGRVPDGGGTMRLMVWNPEAGRIMATLVLQPAR